MLPCFGFGWGDYQLTTYPVDLLSHLECPGFKIQVIPLKGADLTPAQACGQFRQEQFIAAPLWPGSVNRWLSTGVSTFISLGLAEGSLQPAAGFRKIRFSSIALSRAAWKVVWMLRTA